MLTGWAERKKSGPRSLGRDHQSGPPVQLRAEAHWPDTCLST